MKKPHTTLKVRTNLALVGGWALSVAVLASLAGQTPKLEIVVGVLLGLFGGYMQQLSFKEGRERFLEASTALEVRRMLKATKWGKRYLSFLWFSGIGLATLTFTSAANPVIAFPAAYFSMMCARESVTLKATFELRRMLHAGS